MTFEIFVEKNINNLLPQSKFARCFKNMVIMFENV